MDNKHSMAPYADPPQRVPPPVTTGRSWGEVLILLHFIAAVTMFFGFVLAGWPVVHSLLASTAYFLIITLVYVLTASGAMQSIFYDWQWNKTERYRIQAVREVKELEMRLQYKQRQLPPLGQRNWVSPNPPLPHEDEYDD